MRKDTNSKGLRKGQRLRVCPFRNWKLGGTQVQGQNTFRKGSDSLTLSRLRIWILATGSDVKAGAFSFLIVRSLQVQCFVTEKSELILEDLLEQSYSYISHVYVSSPARSPEGGLSNLRCIDPLSSFPAFPSCCHKCLKYSPHSILKMTSTLFTRDLVFHVEDGNLASCLVLGYLGHTPGSWRQTEKKLMGRWHWRHGRYSHYVKATKCPLLSTPE